MIDIETIVWVSTEQWHGFRKYSVLQNVLENVLFLIGDPSQADRSHF